MNHIYLDKLSLALERYQWSFVTGKDITRWLGTEEGGRHFTFILSRFFSMGIYSLFNKKSNENKQFGTQMINNILPSLALPGQP